MDRLPRAAAAFALALLSLPALTGLGPCATEGLQGIYLDVPTVLEDERAVARLSTSASYAEVAVVEEVGGAEVWRAQVAAGLQESMIFPSLRAGWSRSLELPRLPPGLYTVRVSRSAIDPAQQSVPRYIDTWLAPLLVRPARPAAPVLLVRDVETEQAYNEWGGRSVYSSPPTSIVGLRRPGTKQSTTWSLREAAEILDELGIAWEVADQHWVADRPERLSSYRLVVLIEQMEYMDRPFVDGLEAFVAGGGRLLAIGDELMSIQTRRIAPDVLRCFKFPWRGVDPVLEDDDPGNDDLATYEWARVGRPETRLFGTSAWLAQQPQVGATAWRATREEHWIWERTGLKDGDGFRSIRPDAILDGTDVAWAGDGLPYVANTELTETPPHTLVLATLPTRNASPWWCWPAAGGDARACQRPGWGAIAMREDPSGGAVATIGDRLWFLFQGSADTDPAVRQITRNLFTRLSAPGPVDVYDGYDPAPPD